MENITEEDAQKTRIEIMSGNEAQTALTPEILRDLVRNLVATTFDGPKLNPNMSREEVTEILDRYGYPREIIRELEPSQQGDAIKYDEELLNDMVSSARNQREESIYNQAKDTSDAEMLVAKVEGKVVGMLGIRRLGTTDDGRKIYEHVKASVLLEYRNQGTFHQLKQKAIKIMFNECPNPLLLVHSKTPVVIKWAEHQKHRVITCEEYVKRHPKWQVEPEALEALKKIWEEQGWKYFEVSLSKEDFQKES